MTTNVIDKPSGQPFETVGTEEAKNAIDEMAASAANAPFTDQEANDTHASQIRDLLAHRDHLHAQVGELQASNTEHVTARRTAEAQLAGMNAYLDGKNLDANPYVEGDAAHTLWAKGWKDLRYPRLIRMWWWSDK